MERLIKIAAELLDFCETQSWRACVIGELSVQRWGEPRLTGTRSNLDWSPTSVTAPMIWERFRKAQRGRNRYKDDSTFIPIYGKLHEWSSSMMRRRAKRTSASTESILQRLARSGTIHARSRLNSDTKGKNDSASDCELPGARIDSLATFCQTGHNARYRQVEAGRVHGETFGCSRGTVDLLQPGETRRLDRY